MKKVTDDLVTQAVKLFAEPFDKLLNSVDAKCKLVSTKEVDPQTYSLPAEMQSQVQAAVEDWKMAGKVRRLWARDASLWSGTDEGGWLGWLGITEDELADRQRFTSLAADIKRQASSMRCCWGWAGSVCPEVLKMTFEGFPECSCSIPRTRGRVGGPPTLHQSAADIKKAGFKHALLLGMGGSSLCPEVLKMTFGKTEGFPEMFVLDSTDPAQVKATQNKVDIGNTIFIVSSKSGTTLEPNIFKQYFFELVKQKLGTKVDAEEAGRRFIAVTDPGSKFEQIAEGDHFRHIFHGVPSIGGRYSALSDFGMVPAAVMGMDAPRFLDRADVMAIACSSCLPVDRNPGVLLGLILGVAARNGNATRLRSSLHLPFGISAHGWSN